METPDALVLANQATRLGLIQPHDVQEVWDELGERGGDPERFLRILERKGRLTPWQSSKLLKGEIDGYFLGGYRLLYKIASGTFGRVYRADDPRTGRVVAIKVLRKKWSENKHVVDLFEREGRMGMSLKHPNIVEVLAVNQDPLTKSYYIVMEFIEGCNLREHLAARKKLEPKEVIRILEDTASGLAYAFSRGITHRDMKLTNVLIHTASKVAKLVDFGLAEITQMFKNHWDVTGEVTVDRTVDYAGLEKLTGVPHGDTRSDIFFLGCVAYEMASGRSPMTMTKDKQARMQRERFLNIAPLTPADVQAPTSFFRLIETMMSLDTSVRYQTPSQLLDAIRDVKNELEGTGKGKTAAPKSLFLIERDERLQNVLREKLKEQGFRVLLAADPQRALERYRQNPFDLLIVDAGTVGEDGILVFDRLLGEAARLGLTCAGILLLGQDQQDWRTRIQPHTRMKILQHPVKLKTLLQSLQEFR
ncbi:MAG: serine/threonine-protein kinase [Gemmataceae bacterium]|nr:serine/threonine-protein kinase [Gemmataceae bacterium]